MRLIRNRSLPELASEARIEETCSQILALDGWRPFKTEPVRDRARGVGFGEKGMCDYLYIRYTPSEGAGAATVIWIEWKRQKTARTATKAAPHQLEWHMTERAKGAKVYLAGVDFEATIEGFLEWYKNSGYQRTAVR